MNLFVTMRDPNQPRPLPLRPDELHIMGQILVVTVMIASWNPTLPILTDTQSHVVTTTDQITVQITSLHDNMIQLHKEVSALLTVTQPSPIDRNLAVMRGAMSNGVTIMNGIRATVNVHVDTGPINNHNS